MSIVKAGPRPRTPVRSGQGRRHSGSADAPKTGPLPQCCAHSIREVPRVSTGSTDLADLQRQCPMRTGLTQAFDSSDEAFDILSNRDDLTASERLPAQLDLLAQIGEA